MACSQNPRRFSSQAGYHETLASLQGSYQKSHPSSSFHSGGSLATRNRNSVQDLTRNFQEFCNNNAQIGVPPALKRQRNSTVENPSTQDCRFPSYYGDFAGGRDFQTDTINNSSYYVGSMPTNDSRMCIAPSTNNRFGGLVGEDYTCGALWSSEYDHVRHSDRSISSRGSSRESSEGFMSREELERCSPSRKDGIDSHKEMYLRYSYCSFLQNLGTRLELPQTTIGTAMVLCHRFFFRHSHACHDRFLIATASLFLAAKSEETPRPLNDVLKAALKICHKHGFSFIPCLLSVNWFEEYREHVIGAEHIILTTLDFELGVQHPYIPLTSVLNKLGLAQSVLVSVAWNLVNNGLRSSLWLQFKPHHIAAGALFLASKILNMDLCSNQSLYQEFQTTPSILEDVVQQLMELI